MARPRKSGLDYFPFDVDFFEDEKVVAIAGEFGIKGEIAAIKLLCAIYRNGYFMEWSEMLQYKLLRQMPGVSAELFNQILNRLVRWGFFDASLFDSVKVLTSEGIQRRYFSITRKRACSSEKLPYLLVSPAETQVSTAETKVSPSETPQSKVKKSKVKISPDGDNAREGETEQMSLDFDEDKSKGSKRKKSSPKRTPEPPPPTLNEVKAFFASQRADERLQDWEREAEVFYNHFTSLGWRTSAGAKIQRWESRANLWIIEHEQTKKQESISHETDKTDKFSSRRGTEPGSKSRKGFKGTF